MQEEVNMRKLFRAAAALTGLLVTSLAANAADLYVKAKPPAPMPPPFSWTGFYIGGNLGGAWANNNVTDTLTGVNFSTGTNNGVFVGGGQVGFNYQMSNIVWGVEADFDWASNNNNNGNGVVIAGPLGLGHTFAVALNNRSIVTLAARLGVAYDRVLFYVKGGGGWVGANGFTVTDLNTGASVTSSGSSDGGWLVGGGFEWAFADNWSARVEYDFLGLSGRTVTVPLGAPVLAGDTFTSGNRNVQMLTVGLNWRFNWGGSMVAARY
jgi:outer membrane immunogenic protein